jgi:plasmid stability protein
MARIVIEDLDEGLTARLRVRAARHGRSMEEEARAIIKTALAADPAQVLNLAESIRRRIDPLGGVEPVVPAREEVRRPADFAK